MTTSKINRIIDLAFPDLSRNALEVMGMIEEKMAVSFHGKNVDGEVGELFCRFVIASCIQRLDNYLLGKEPMHDEDRAKMLEILEANVH